MRQRKWDRKPRSHKAPNSGGCTICRLGGGGGGKVEIGRKKEEF